MYLISFTSYFTLSLMKIPMQEAKQKHVVSTVYCFLQEFSYATSSHGTGISNSPFISHNGDITTHTRTRAHTHTRTHAQIYICYNVELCCMMVVIGLWKWQFWERKVHMQWNIHLMFRVNYPKVSNTIINLPSFQIVLISVFIFAPQRSLTECLSETSFILKYLAITTSIVCKL